MKPPYLPDWLDKVAWRVPAYRRWMMRRVCVARLLESEAAMRHQDYAAHVRRAIQNLDLSRLLER